MQPTREKPPYIDLEYKRKANIVFCTNLDPSTTNERKIYPDLCRLFLIILSRGNKYIYVMYRYYCNTILTTAMNNRSDKGMIQVFTELTEELKAAESTYDSTSWTMNNQQL